MSELVSNETSFNNQICGCEIKINDLKFQIENFSINKSQVVISTSNCRSILNSPKNGQIFKKYVENNEESEEESIGILLKFLFF